MDENIIFRNETEADYREVENLTRESFWNVYRPGCSEHYVLHQFRNRADFVKELDFVMEKDGKIIGHAMYARAEIKQDDGTSLPMMTLGPISIAPEYKRKGYGTMLLQYSVEKAAEMGAGALAFCGNSHFYGKSGFVPAKSKGVRYAEDPEADYFLIKELTPGFLDGVSGTFKEPDGYFVDDADVEEFDKRFPPKEKLVLPGQIF